MSEKTMTTIILVAGVVVLVMFMSKRSTTAKVMPNATKTTTGSSLWADIGSGLGGFAKGIFGGSSSSSSSSSGSGDYTWQGYQDSDLSLGGGEG